MKRSKQILAMLLCAVLALSLCACTPVQKGDGGTQPGGNGGTGGSGTGGGNSGGTVQEDTYVYVPEYVTVDSEMGNYPGGMLYQDGRFLVSSYGVIRSEIPEGVTPEYEGQYDVYGTRFYWLNLDGSVELLSGYEPLPLPEFDEDVQGRANSYVNSFLLAPDGGLAVLENVYLWWYDGPDDVEMYSDEWYSGGYYEYQHNEEHYYLRLLNEDGSEQACFSLESLQGEETDYFYINGFGVDSCGNFYFASDTSLYAMDGMGNLLKTIQTENWVNSIVSLPDGRAAITSWGETGMELIPIDPVSLELDSENSIELGNNYFDMSSLAGSSEYDILYTSGTNLMGFKLADGSSTKVLNWINCDVNPNNLNGQVMQLEDGRIVTIETQWDSEYRNATNTLVFLKMVPASSVAQRTVLTLATQYLDYQMRERIVKFNRSSTDYRIEVLDYSEYNTEDDYQGGVTKLTAELMAGNMPDILDLNGLPAEKLGAKGILRDLYPLLNGDSELNGQILEGVLNALETNGKLYRTASSFNLSAVIGAASVVGDTPGWTTKDFQLALSNMPDGCDPFNVYTTRDNMFSNLLNINWDQLVDWDTGKCRFDDGLLAGILQFAAQFPSEFDWDNYQWSEEDDEYARIASGRQMLMQTALYSFRDWQSYNAIFGGDATCIGYPVSEGTGNAFRFSDSGYAITTGCKNPEIAWDFVRVLFTAEYQGQYSWRFPTNKEAFQKQLDEAMTPQYQTDVNGNYILDENGDKIEILDYWGWGTGGVSLGAMSQREADKLLEAINTTTRTVDYDTNELYEMISADCEAFFSGQKSAEEVCRLLQSKMTIYVNEQR